MTSSRSEKLAAQMKLVEKTHFDLEEVTHLGDLFDSAAVDDVLDRTHYREVLMKHFDITEDFLLDRLYRAFCNGGKLTKENFTVFMSIFLRGTGEERRKFVFDLYDVNPDGFITREEMIFLLQQAVVKAATAEDREEGTKELVDLVMKQMDKDKDGSISFADYEASVAEDPLLLEVFGHCLPEPTKADAFMLPSFHL